MRAWSWVTPIQNSKDSSAEVFMPLRDLMLYRGSFLLRMFSEVVNAN